MQKWRKMITKLVKHKNDLYGTDPGNRETTTSITTARNIRQVKRNIHILFVSGLWGFLFPSRHIFSRPIIKLLYIWLKEVSWGIHHFLCFQGQLSYLNFYTNMHPNCFVLRVMVDSSTTLTRWVDINKSNLWRHTLIMTAGRPSKVRNLKWLKWPEIYHT